MGRIDPQFVVLETDHWIVNHRRDATLPGYLMVAARQGSSLSDQPSAALAEIGPLLARVQSTVERSLGAERTYIGRFGHSPEWGVHFHVVPVYPWLGAALAADARYSHLRGHHGFEACGFDGADMLLYVWREWTTAEGRASAPPGGPDAVVAAIALLRAALVE